VNTLFTQLQSHADRAAEHVSANSERRTGRVRATRAPQRSTRDCDPEDPSEPGNRYAEAEIGHIEGAFGAHRHRGRRRQTRCDHGLRTRGIDADVHSAAVVERQPEHRRQPIRPRLDLAARRQLEDGLRARRNREGAEIADEEVAFVRERSRDDVPLARRDIDPPVNPPL
jgi:hypothetical protein